MSYALAAEVLARLGRVLPSDGGPYPLHEPAIGGNAWAYVKDCLDTGWVSSVGGYVDRFEAAVAEATGADAAIATVNGTAALHVCLQLAGILPGDEVLVPALTFVATANVVRYCGAVPHFVDAEGTSLGVDAAALEAYLGEIAEPGADGWVNHRTGRRLRALVVMHCCGHAADLDALAAVAEAFGLALIEDAAEALGSRCRGAHVGTGRLATLSFNGNKTVTTGGGGAVLTNDAALAAAAKHLTTTARADEAHAFSHDRVAFNYRLPNLNAALGCAQLEQLADLLAAKRRLAEDYAAAFAGLDAAQVLPEPAYGESNHWLNVLVLAPEVATERLALLRRLSDAGYLCRPLWTPMHALPMYRDCPRMALPVTEDLFRRTILLPSSPGLRLG